jgi:FkbM family methyltransferase
MSVRKIARALYYSIPSPRVRSNVAALAARPFRNSVRRMDLGGYVAELHLGESMEFAAFLGSFERDVADHIDRYAKPGMTVLDIGANVGLHALRLAHRVGREGQVFAFEPSGYAYRKLAKNASLNPEFNLAPLQLGLSNQNQAGVEMRCCSSWQMDGSRADEEVSIVDLVRMDDWIVQEGLARLDLIKIDVDGYEGLIFDGARRTLERFRPIIIAEAFNGQYVDGRPDPFGILAELNYSVRDMSGAILSPESIRERLSQLDQIYAVSFNVIAIP